MIILKLYCGKCHRTHEIEQNSENVYVCPYCGCVGTYGYTMNDIEIND